jgi:hypothetical protein
VCVDKNLSFISESSGEILLFSYQKEVQVKHRAMQGVHRLVKTLRVINSGEGEKIVVAKSAQSPGLK